MGKRDVQRRIDLRPAAKGGIVNASGGLIQGVGQFQEAFIGAWHIAAYTLTDRAKTMGFSTVITEEDDVRLWINGAVPTEGQFRVTESGVVTASAGHFGYGKSLAAIGDLAGLYGYPDDAGPIYGNAVGAYEPGATWIGTDVDNGLRIMNYQTRTFQVAPDGVAAFGRADQNEIIIDPLNAELRFSYAGVTQMALDAQNGTLYGIWRLGRPLGPCLELSTIPDISGDERLERFGLWLRNLGGDRFFSVLSGTEAAPETASFRVGTAEQTHFLEFKDNLLDIAGNLRLTDAEHTMLLNVDVPSFAMGDATDYDAGEGIWFGLHAGTYKMRVGDPLGSRFEYDGLIKIDGGFFAGTLDSPLLEMEIMRISFASISWTQFAISDSFADDSLRLTPETATYPAVVIQGKLYNGADATPGRAFGFHSKVYPDITTVASGTSTDVGAGYLEDTAGTWFIDQYKGYQLVDSDGTVFTLTGCSILPSYLLFASGTPAAGAYTIRSAEPAYTVGFMSYSDSSNGGTGDILLEMSYDGGEGFGSWLTLYWTGLADRLGGTIAIAVPGRSYQFKLTLTNDGAGAGPEVYHVLVCTDPSVWS